MTIKNLLQSALKPTTKPTKLSVGGRLEMFGVYELTQPSPTQAPLFAIRKKNTPLQFANETHDNTYTYKPYERVPWPLPTGATAYDSTEKLWNDIRSCIFDHIDHPDDAIYDVLTGWILASWTVEKWTTAPYIFAYGTFNTGKSRVIEVLSRLCHRGWLASNVSPATVYRIVDMMQPTLFIDESELVGNNVDLIALLNAGYRRGLLIPRMKETSDGYTPEFFNCYGLKGLAGTKSLIKTLESRCILIKTSKKTRPIEFDIDEKRCTQLRNQLLTYRFNVLLSEANEENEESERNYKRGLVDTIGDQRLTELYYPIIQSAPNQTIKEKIVNFAKQNAAIQIDEQSISSESIVLSAILEAHRIGNIQNGKIQISTITEIVNRSLAWNEQMKERTIAANASRLGFQKTRGTGGKTCILWSTTLIERLKQDTRYTLCFNQPPSETASNSSIPSKSSLDVNNLKDVANWLGGE